MSSNTQLPPIQPIEYINDDNIAQIIMADHQYKEIIAKEIIDKKIIDKEDSKKSEAYKLKYLKAKKEYYYKL